MKLHLTSSVFVFMERSDGHSELLLLWHPKLHRWMIPGGHIEPNEDPGAAAIREVMEETGIKVELASMGLTSDMGRFEDVDILPTPAWTVREVVPASAAEAEHLHIDFLFVSKLDEPVRLDARAQWFDVESLPTDQMFPGTVRFASLLASTSLNARDRFQLAR